MCDSGTTGARAGPPDAPLKAREINGADSRRARLIFPADRMENRPADERPLLDDLLIQAVDIMARLCRVVPGQ